MRAPPRAPAHVPAARRGPAHRPINQMATTLPIRPGTRQIRHPTHCLWHRRPHRWWTTPPLRPPRKEWRAQQGPGRSHQSKRAARHVRLLGPVRAPLGSLPPLPSCPLAHARRPGFGAGRPVLRSIYRGVPGPARQSLPTAEGSHASTFRCTNDESPPNRIASYVCGAGRRSPFGCGL